MSEDAAPPVGPDLEEGYPLDRLQKEAPLFGHVGDTPVLLILRDGEPQAFTAVCTHYGAPLADGLVTDDTVRCPWHHACFSLDSGDPLGGPALASISRRSVTVEEGEVRVGAPVDEESPPRQGAPEREPESVVIIGAGAAGTVAAETLRREGYAGPVTLVDPDPDAPYDRPNLSKDYLAGSAPEEWMPLRSEEFFREKEIRRREARVAAIRPDDGELELEDGSTLPFGVLLLTPGAAPRTLDLPGSDGDHVFLLRSFDDCRSIIEKAEESERAVVIGASFIGMEVAASLRQRDLEVTVVAPEEVPFAATLGEEMGSFVRSLHEEEGVRFRLGTTPSEIRDGALVLEDGEELPADLVVVGVGVEPRVELAEGAGLDTDDGILVDEHLRTSHPRVFAAGDAARYPEARLGERVRIEHWVLAQRQGRTAARNILGRGEVFGDVPFFWTEHYGTPVAYLGHAPDWDEARKEGDCGDDGCAVTFFRGGRRVALATVYRDELSLKTELEMEKEAQE